MMASTWWSIFVLVSTTLAGSTFAQFASGSGIRSQASSSLNISGTLGGFISGGPSQTGSATSDISSKATSSSAEASRPSASGVKITSTTTLPSASASTSRSRLAPTTGAGNITDCQSALVSWSSRSSQIVQPYITNVTSTITTRTTTIVSEGIADVYTTIGGYTHAHGDLTVTALRGIIAIVLSATTSRNVLKLPTGVTTPAYPTCTIDPSSCSALYSAYSSSLGITKVNATLPYISPTPTNSPRCALSTGCVYYYNTDGCTVSGRSVHVFYWPPEPTGTAAFVNATSRARRNSTSPRTVVTSGITMTSPSVYLSFDYLSAFTYFDGGQKCDTFADGAVGFQQVGSTHTSSWLSLMPTEVSTLEKMTWDGTTTRTFPDAAITALGKANATDYIYWASAVSAAGYGWQPSRLDFAKLTRPDPRAYYLAPTFDPGRFTATYAVGEQPELYAKGCFPYGPHPGCNTIFDDLYRAQISLPTEIRNIDPAWSTCGPILYGVRDPPIALTAADDPVDPIVSTTTTAPSTQGPAVPASTPVAPTVSITALPVVTTSVRVGTSSARVERSAAELLTPTPASPVSAADPEQSTSTSSQSAQTVTFAAPPANTLQSAADALGALTQPAPTPTQSAAPTAVITAGQSTITATSSDGNVIIGGATLTSGQVTSINGATISNAGSAVVVQPPAPTVQQATTLATVGSQGVVAQPGSTGVIVGGSTTLTQGQATTIGGTIISVGSTAVVIGSSTLALPSSQASPTTIASAGTQAIVALPGSTGVVIGGTATLTAGQSTTIAGTVVSVGSTAIIIGSSTVALPTSQPAATTLATAGSQGIVAQPGGTGVVIGGTATLTAGQSTTISGTVISVGSTALVVGSSTIALPTAGPSQIVTSISVREPSITIAGSIITANTNGAFVIGSLTALPGGPAITVSGTTISVAPSDAYVIVNGVTSTLARPVTQTIVVTVLASGSAKAGASAATTSPTASATGAGISASSTNKTSMILLLALIGLVAVVT